MGKNKIINYKGRKYELTTVRKSNASICPGCAFDGKETFCIRINSKLNATERAMTKDCSSLAHKQFTNVWVEIPYPWYERFWNWITRKE